MESEVVSVDYHISGIIWSMWLLEAQGYKVEYNIFYQDNQRAITM